MVDYEMVDIVILLKWRKIYWVFYKVSDSDVIDDK